MQDNNHDFNLLVSVSVSSTLTILVFLSIIGTLLYWISSLMMLAWAFFSAARFLSLPWMALLQMARMKMMMTLEAMLKMPHAVMMIGRRTSMLRAPAMCSGSSEMDWKLSFYYNKTVTPFYNIYAKLYSLKGFVVFKVDYRR